MNEYWKDLAAEQLKLARNRIALCQPLARVAFFRMQEHLVEAFDGGKVSSLFLAFEAYRTPERQNELYQGKKPVTNAKAWESPHQYGLAVDFVPYAEGGWSWAANHPWNYLYEMAPHFQLAVPIVWDRAHVEHPLWKELREVLRTAKR